MTIKGLLNSLNNALTPNFHMIISKNYEIIANLLWGISHQQRISEREGQIYQKERSGLAEISVKRVATLCQV
jgi:hypothetical protein